MKLVEQPKKIKVAAAVLIGITLIALVSSVVLWSKVRTLENPGVATQKEIKQLVAQIGKLIVLPENETPTLATVSDPAKLRDQAFFQNSEAGDKVLIYPDSRRAILWRPSIKKIIEISPLNATPTVQ